MLIQATTTADIISGIIAEFNADAIGVISSVVDEGGGQYTINTKTTGWARVGSVIVINGNDYTVISFVQSVSIRVSGTPDPTGQTAFTLPAVNFFHDTYIGQKEKLQKTDSLTLKFPMVWLYETIRETKDDVFDSEIDRISDCRFFILDNSNFESWYVEQHYDFIITPMLNLAESLNGFFLNHKKNGKFDEHIFIPHKNFGTFVTQGHVKQILSEMTSGIEYQVNLPFTKQFKCT